MIAELPPTNSFLQVERGTWVVSVWSVRLFICDVHLRAEAHVKIARMTLTIKLDGNWSSFQLANSTPPLSVTGSAIAPSARMGYGQKLCSKWFACICKSNIWVCQNFEADKPRSSGHDTHKVLASSHHLSLTKLLNSSSSQAHYQKINYAMDDSIGGS